MARVSVSDRSATGKARWKPPALDTGPDRLSVADSAGDSGKHGALDDASLVALGAAPVVQSAPRQTSRRRASNEARLRQSLSAVNEHLGQCQEQEVGLQDFTSSTLRPTPSGRKSVSLKFPRSKSQGPPQKEVSHASSCSTSAGDRSSSTPRSNTPSEPQAGTPSDFPALPPGALTVEQVEDLRMQNAILRRSLSMLQQSVVESFKGNKGQFVGGGVFRKRASDKGAPDERRSAGVPREAEVDVDLEALQAAITRMRGELKCLTEERDTSRAEADALRLRIKELSDQHAEALANGEQERERSDALSLALSKRIEELRASEEAMSASEQRCSEATKRIQMLEAEVARLEECVSAGEKALALETDKSQALEGKLALSEEAERMLREEQASLLTACGQLRAECEGLRESNSSQCMRVGMLEAERRQRALRLLSSLALGDGGDQRLWLQTCFGAWVEHTHDGHTVRLRTRVNELVRQAAEAETAQSKLSKGEEEARRRCAEAEEQLRAAAEKLALVETQRDKLQQVAEESQKSQEELNAKLVAARQQCVEAEKRAEASANSLKEAQSGAEKLASELAAERSRREALEKESQNRGALTDQLAAAKREVEAAKAAAAKAKQAEDKAKQAEESLRKHMDENIRKQKEEASRGRKALEETQKALDEARKQLEILQKNLETSRSFADASVKEAAELKKANAALTAQQAKTSEAGDKELSALRKQAEQADSLQKQKLALTKETDDLRVDLSLAKGEASTATDLVKLLRSEKAEIARQSENARASLLETENRCQELARSVDEWKGAAKQTISEMQRGTRIMVTAPKVCINVGGNEKGIHVPFPFEAIKSSVQNEVIPKFNKVMAISGDSRDEDIRADVHQMVEQLALTLQSKVCELMPQAEGTCNWDGFGAKCSSLGDTLTR